MSWKKLKISGNCPAARGGHTATMFQVDDKKCIAVFGGSDRHGHHFNDTHFLELVPGSNDSFAKGAFKWIATSPSAVAPAGRSGHSAVFFQDSVYLFGGQCVLAMNEEEQNAEFYSDLWRLDVRTHQWTEVQTSGSLPTGRNAHTACVVDECMYVIGGSNQDGPLDDVAVLNLKTLVWESIAPRASPQSSSVGDVDDDAPPVPEAREMHTAVVSSSGRSVLVFGGRTAVTICDHFYEFLIDSKTWKLHDRCDPRCGHASVTFGQRVLHVGGTDGQQLFEAVQVFNTDLLVWTDVNPSGTVPRPRFAHTLTSVAPGEALLFGGAGVESEFNDAFLLVDGDAFSHGLAS